MQPVWCSVGTPAASVLSLESSASSHEVSCLAAPTMRSQGAIPVSDRCTSSYVYRCSDFFSSNSSFVTPPPPPPQGRCAEAKSVMIYAVNWTGYQCRSHLNSLAIWKTSFQNDDGLDLPSVGKAGPAGLSEALQKRPKKIVCTQIRLPAESRSVSLTTIAKSTKLSQDGVEFLLMKTLSLHLIEGSIDQVGGTVQVRPLVCLYVHDQL